MVADEVTTYISTSLSRPYIFVLLLNFDFCKLTNGQINKEVKRNIILTHSHKIPHNSLTELIQEVALFSESVLSSLHLFN